MNKPAFLILVLLLSLSAAVSGRTGKSPLGVNVSSFPYYGTQYPFKNLYMYQAGTWAMDNQTPVVYASDGYPLSFDTTGWQRPYKYVVIHGPGKYPSGDWVLLYDGQGDLSFQWDATSAVKTREGRYTFKVVTPKDGIVLKITRTHPANHLRNIRIVQAQYESNYESEPWNPEFLDFFQDFSVIRFMNWMDASTDSQTYNTYGCGSTPCLWQSVTPTTLTLASNASPINDQYNNMVLQGLPESYHLITDYDGATRTLTFAPALISVPSAPGHIIIHAFGDREWPERIAKDLPLQNTWRGMALEWMVDLCNRLKIDPWFTLPTAASDNYMRQFAIYVRDHLDPNLKIYIEWSNEAWNFSYPGYFYSSAYGAINGAGGHSGYPAYRSVQLFRIFNDVFREPNLRTERTGSRLIRVLSGHTAWLARGVEVMEFNGSKLKPGFANPIDSGKRAADYADVWAITNYIKISGDDTAQKTYYRTHTENEIIDSLIRVVDHSFDSARQGEHFWNIKNARQRGLPTIVYEAGWDLYNDPVDSLVAAKGDALDVNPRMKEFYLRLLNQWKSLGNSGTGKGTELWCQFTDTQWSRGQNSRYGRWGVRQYMTQPISESPRWQALREFATNNERWWTEQPGAGTETEQGGSGSLGETCELAVSPNPFNPTVRISLKAGIKPASPLTLAVYDIFGKRVIDLSHTLSNGTTTWNARSVASGIYIVKFTAGAMTRQAKIYLVR